jgi:hypothetical protein
MTGGDGDDAYFIDNQDTSANSAVKAATPSIPLRHRPQQHRPRNIEHGTLTGAGNTGATGNGAQPAEAISVQPIDGAAAPTRCKAAPATTPMSSTRPATSHRTRKGGIDTVKSAVTVSVPHPSGDRAPDLTGAADIDAVGSGWANIRSAHGNNLLTRRRRANQMIGGKGDIYVVARLPTS